jgi:hypothetical protein
MLAIKTHDELLAPAAAASAVWKNVLSAVWRAVPDVVLSAALVTVAGAVPVDV